METQSPASPMDASVDGPSPAGPADVPASLGLGLGMSDGDGATEEEACAPLEMPDNDKMLDEGDRVDASDLMEISVPDHGSKSSKAEGAVSQLQPDAEAGGGEGGTDFGDVSASHDPPAASGTDGANGSDRGLPSGDEASDPARNPADGKAMVDDAQAVTSPLDSPPPPPEFPGKIAGEAEAELDDGAAAVVAMTGGSFDSAGPCRSIEEASVNTTVEVEPFPMEDAKGGTIADAPTAASGDDALEGSTSLRPHSPPSHHHDVTLRLTPQEEDLFRLLAEAAEAYEAGGLSIDPNPDQRSVSARGGFTKNESSDPGDASWLSMPPRVERIEIRVAGGWVRDKLLNQHSVDVDIALDCMMGVQFARIVQSYLALKQEQEDEKRDQGETANGEATDGGGGGGGKGKKKQPRIGVIGANPSQSKHLETATMNINGMDVDFVNLRAEEVYESHSRIPTSDTRMFGTPLEDALRRDFTINSLFYNVRSGRVEDWTGRGLDDLLVHRRIVTPVDANVTFHDDPLRVLRAVRFCVRLDFTLDEQIREAAMSQRVHHSLHVKVSRERVGKEVEGMLTGKHARPGRALDMIAGLHLAGSVFAFPGSIPGDHDYVGGPVSGSILDEPYNCSIGTDGPDAIEAAARHRARGWEESSSLLGVLPTIMEGHADERERVLRDRVEREEGRERGDGGGEEDVAASLPSVVDPRLLHLCVFILPFHNLTFPDRKGREVMVTSQMIKEALKFPVRDIQAVSKILTHVEGMAAILEEIRSQLAEQQVRGGLPIRLTPPCRLRAGLLLRSLKEHWVTCLLAAAAWEIRSRRGRRGADAAGAVEDGTDDAPIAVPSEQPSREFYRAVADDLDLDECWKVRPHLNGKELIRELRLPKGPMVGKFLDDQTRWMLLNPGGTKDECVLHLRERKREREGGECGNGGETTNEQNEANVGVANGAGHLTKVGGGQICGAKHFSKKIRAEK